MSSRTQPSGYWRAARAPRHSLLFALPLLLLYELLAFALSRSELVEVRNGADVLLKSIFVTLGGRYGLSVFSAVFLCTGSALVLRDRIKHGPIVPRLFAGMLL